MLINIVNVDRINVDPINSTEVPMPDPTDSTARFVTTTEAAARLGVKKATLYAYVSRGLLRSERRPGQQESLFDLAQVEALATTTRPSTSGRPLLRFRGIGTTISSHVDGDLQYRRIPLESVLTAGDFETAARLVLGLDPDVDTPPPHRPTAPGLPDLVAALPLQRRVPVMVHALAATDPLSGSIDPTQVTVTALRLVPDVVAAMVSGAAAYGPNDVPLAVLHALGRRDPGPADVDLLRTLLICLLDHGLTASTIAARVAASTRAGLHDCLLAGYAAMAGPLHGAAPIAARQLIDDPAPAPRAVATATRGQETVPGFGHFLYPDGDPRAVAVFSALWERRGTARLRRRVGALTDVVGERTGAAPNIDLATAAALSALDLPAATGELVFQVARTYGMAAHVAEEYSETPLRWRGRESTD